MISKILLIAAAAAVVQAGDYAQQYATSYSSFKRYDVHAKPSTAYIPSEITKSDHATSINNNPAKPAEVYLPTEHESKPSEAYLTTAIKSESKPAETYLPVVKTEHVIHVPAKPTGSYLPSHEEKAEASLIKTEHIIHTVPSKPTGSYLPSHEEKLSLIKTEHVIREIPVKPIQTFIPAPFKPAETYLPGYVKHVVPDTSLHAPHFIKTEPVHIKPAVSYIPSIVKTPTYAPQAFYYPKYEFKYGVQDPHTGDIKNHQEERDGDVVKGEYSFIQPDGVRRTVHYVADHSGFNAQVEYSGHFSHPVEKVHKAVPAGPY